MTKQEKEEQQQVAREWLLKHLKPGDTVYTLVRHVSASGMSRSITLLTIYEGEIVNLDWAAARLLGDFDQKYGGVKTDVVGMDATFSVVYDLSQILFGVNEGKALTRIQI